MRLLTTLIALLASIAMLAPTAAAETDLDCDAIDAYLDDVDTAITAEVHALVTAPGWTDDAGEAVALLERAGADTSGIAPDEISALTDLFAVTGDVLSAMDPDTIPGSAAPLHAASTAFWVAMPDWLLAMLTGDTDAGQDASATLDARSREAATAVGAIDDACPGLLDSHLDNAGQLGALFDLLDSPGANLDALANATLEDLDGIGVYFLILPESWSLGVAAPVATPVREPATVKPVSPASTPVATPGT